VERKLAEVNRQLHALLTERDELEVRKQRLQSVVNAPLEEENDWSKTDFPWSTQGERIVVGVAVAICHNSVGLESFPRCPIYCVPFPLFRPSLKVNQLRMETFKLAQWRPNQLEVINATCSQVHSVERLRPTH